MTRATWVCVFRGHSGARGRAVFETKEQARQFAERHARAITPAGVPLKWEDAEDSATLTTVLGDYLVAPLSEDERRRFGLDES
jgi:hypothetical protein